MNSEPHSPALSQKESHSFNAPVAPDSFGAIRMVPPEEFDDPLTERELTMKFGEPVIVEGTNYSELSTRYLQATGRIPEDESFRDWLAQPLQSFSSKAETAEMHYSHRLLVLCDQLKDQGITGKDAHQILKEKHKYVCCERTLRRQCAYARFALILAASGRIHLLPSQNVCSVIAGAMPRQAWVSFLSAHPVKESSTPSVKKKIINFAERRGITLRGRPAGHQEPGSRTLLSLSDSTEPSAIIRGACENQEEEAPSVQNPKRVVAKKLSKHLVEELQKSVPAYHLQDSAAFAKVFVQELDAKIASVPRPARHGKLDALAQSLSRLDLARAQAIEQAAIRLLLGQVLDRATDLAGANAHKKATLDTVCPKSPEKSCAQPKEEPFL